MLKALVSDAPRSRSDAQDRDAGSATRHQRNDAAIDVARRQPVSRPSFPRFEQAGNRRHWARNFNLRQSLVRAVSRGSGRSSSEEMTLL